MNSKQNRRRAKPRRRGAAVVEFALVSPLLIMLTMGLMEIGRVVMVKQLLINASREGARLAILPGSSTADAKAEVTSALLPSITGATPKVTNHLGAEIEVSSAPSGTPITVSVSIPAASVSWIPHPLFTINSTLEASTTMRREGQ